MIYRKTDNMEIPALGFGTYQLNENTCVDSVLNALEVGYRHIDTAEAYGNESQIGEVLKSSGIARNDLFITSKVWRDNLDGESMSDSLNRSLEKLHTDYLDLYLIHWPSNDLPLEKSMEALAELKEKGLTKLIGVSNFTPELLKRALDYDVSNVQVEYHPFLNQNELLKLVEQHNLLFTAYSPLAHGQVFENEKLKEIADRHVKHAGQVALRWLIQHDNVIAIPRSSNKEHIRSNFEVFDFELSREEMDVIQQFEEERRLVDPEFAPKW